MASHALRLNLLDLLDPAGTTCSTSLAQHAGVCEITCSSKMLANVFICDSSFILPYAPESCQARETLEASSWVYVEEADPNRQAEF